MAVLALRIVTVYVSVLPASALVGFTLLLAFTPGRTTVTFTRSLPPLVVPTLVLPPPKVAPALLVRVTWCVPAATPLNVVLITRAL